MYKIFRYPFNQYGLQNGWLHVKHAWQRAFRGFDDTAYWGLSSYIIDIALPVLKHYRKHKSGVPLLDEFKGDGDFKLMKKEWDKRLDKMIRAFQLMYDQDHTFETFKGSWRQRMAKEQKEIDEGMALFAKHFQGLWD